MNLFLEISETVETIGISNVVFGLTVTSRLSGLCMIDYSRNGASSALGDLFNFWQIGLSGNIPQRHEIQGGVRAQKRNQTNSAQSNS